MNIYQNNIKKYSATISELTKTLKKLSATRVIAFVLSVVIIIILVNEGSVFLLLMVAPLCVLGFGLLVNRYNQVVHLKQHNTFLKEINEFEILRLKNKLSGFPAGHAFIERDHPYVSDLDIFGAHSLFQLLNRTTTESGNICLAEWLSEPAPKEVILERQEAVKELTAKIEWRQDLQASGMHFKNAKSDYNKLLAWVEKPVELLPDQSKYLIACIVLSLLSTSAAIYFIIHLIHVLLGIHAFSLYYMIPLIIILVVNTLFLRRVRPIAEEIIESTDQNVKILGGYHSLITKIESEQFHSKVLRQLQSDLHQNGYSAASAINKLKKILEMFQLRGTKASFGNQFYSLFNNFWLLDIYWIIMTEKWKDKNRSHLKSWAAAVSEFEVLCSIAGYHYSNPSFTFPEITEEPYNIHFETLGHPLINAEKRVYNSFNLNGCGEIAMITGSNMAGKSTFLRTVGINMALAFMGAPCCASSGQVSNIQLFTSMRTQDNLEEGISSFNAELRRIEQLLKLIVSEQPICFLLDEMFKGTNSKDRHKGGVSLIKQLNGLNAFGIIATHDLELAKLAGNHMIVSNYSFNSTMQDGEMIFDYKLTEGICRDFNASELMKRSGIKIISNIDEV